MQKDNVSNGFVVKRDLLEEFHFKKLLDEKSTNEDMLNLLNVDYKFFYEQGLLEKQKQLIPMLSQIRDAVNNPEISNSDFRELVNSNIKEIFKHSID